MRLFFALWPSRAAAERLASAATDAAARLGGRPTRLETLHLTLAFLGEVADERVPGLLALATNLPAAPFELRIDQPGYWRRNCLFWAGCSNVPAPLDTLAAELRQVGVDLSFTPVLDLDYPEDSNCDTDMNVIMTGQGGIVEVQGTAEGEPFTRAQMSQLVDMAEAGISTLIAKQKETLAA